MVIVGLINQALLARVIRTIPGRLFPILILVIVATTQAFTVIGIRIIIQPMLRSAKYLCLLILIFGTGCIPPKGFLESFLTPVPTPVVITQGAMPQIKIELDVFSGQPNPEWTLSADDATYLLGKPWNLPEIPLSHFDEPLGYRGILVYVSGNQRTTYRIWQKVVTKDNDGKMTAYQDSNRSLEKWLLLSGRSSLQIDLFEIVKKEIERR